MADPRTNDPPWIEILDAHFEKHFQKYHAPIQGLINRYDSAKQLADVQTVVKLVIEGVEQTAAPILRGVSVAFPGGRDHSHTWPLFPGDGMTLIPQDADVGRYLASGSVYQDPRSSRRFSLSDALGFPLVARPQGAVLPPEALAADAAVLYGKTLIGSSAGTKAVGLHGDAVRKATLPTPGAMQLWMLEVELGLASIPFVFNPAKLSTTFTQVGSVDASATKLEAK